MTSRKRDNQRGAAVIEFVFVLIFVILPLLFGIIDFGFIWVQEHYLTEAIHVGARTGAQVAKVEYNPDTLAYEFSSGSATEVEDAVIDAIDRHLQGLPIFAGKLATEVAGNPPTITLTNIAVAGAGRPTPALQVNTSVTIANLWVPILWDLLKLVVPGDPEGPLLVGSTAVFPIAP